MKWCENFPLALCTYDLILGFGVQGGGKGVFFLVECRRRLSLRVHIHRALDIFKVAGNKIATLLLQTRRGGF